MAVLIDIDESLDQFFQQAAKGPDLNSFEAFRMRSAALVKRRSAEIAEQDLPAAVMKRVMGVQVAMHDALLMQMACKRGDA